MQVLAEELRRRGHFATAASYTQEWFGHVNDINLQLNKVATPIKHVRALSFTLWALQNYDIFHFFWGSSLYGFSRFPHLDVRLLSRLGNKRCFVHFRGRDLIDVAYSDYARRRDNTTQYLDAPPMSRPDQMRSLAVWRRHADRLLVSVPGLLKVVPEALLLQQALKLDAWASTREPRSAHDGILRVVHAPSSRRKKGTEFVIDAVDTLKSEGHRIELILVENRPFWEVKELYEQADIGVDELLDGFHGKVSIELMALGRPVISYIDPVNAPHYPEGLPVVSASPTELVHELRHLVQNEAEREKIGAKGPGYVAQHHDVSVIVDRCLDVYYDKV